MLSHRGMMWMTCDFLVLRLKRKESQADGLLFYNRFYLCQRVEVIVATSKTFFKKILMS